MSDIDRNPNIYWVVNDKCYSRKLDALIAADKQKNAKVLFNYYNDQFNQFNWVKEPTQSFDEIVTERALQLRESYSYLRLWYSGGADSHTMLRAFLDNDIHIDEIVMVRSSAINDFDNDSIHREANLRSIPFIKSIQHSIPDTKITLLDMGAEKYLDFYKNEEWTVSSLMFEFTEDPGILLGTQEGMERYGNLTTHYNGAEIYGGDKPKIIRKDGVFYAPIVDSTFYTSYIANANEFYTTPEMLKLHSKQCHVLKRIINKWWPTGDVTHEIYNPETIDKDFKKEWYHCCRNVMNYDIDFGKGWNLVTPKTAGKVANTIDHNPELFKLYSGSIEEFRQNFPNLWEDVSKGSVVGSIAGLYCLGS